MKIKKFAPNLGAFKARARALGYVVRKTPLRSRHGSPYYIAKKGTKLKGVFGVKYPKQGYLSA
jgi:hypothetical protein